MCTETQEYRKFDSDTSAEWSLADMEKRMREGAANLEFEKAARLRDEVKRLKAVVLAVMEDPTARWPRPKGKRKVG